METPQPTPFVNWWDVFESFYFGEKKLPLGVTLWCLLYGIAILVVIYFISFYCFFGFVLGNLHSYLPSIMTWIIVKIANLFLKDAELSIKCIYFYPLDGVIRICKLKLSL